MKETVISKIIEDLSLAGQPKRYIVTNTKKIVLVTYDYRIAQKFAQSIKDKDQPDRYYAMVPS